jgi:hypothetical protein
MTATAAPMSCDVQAQTPVGPLRISIPLTDLLGARESFDHLDIALAVEQCEPLLLELEHWCGVVLDPLPVQAAMPMSAGLSVTMSDRDLAPPGTRLHLPWEALLRRPPDQPLRILQLPWPRLLCEVELARYPHAPGTLGDMPLPQMLLLPESFEHPWQVKLTDARHQLGLEAHYTLCDGVLHDFGPPHRGPDVAPTLGWRVVMTHAVELPLEVALGWRKSQLSVGTEPVQAALLSPATRQPVVQGMVVAALRGAALFVGHDTTTPLTV